MRLRRIAEWAGLVAIIATYLGLLVLAAHLPAAAPWFVLLAPNAWLLGASLLWARQSDLQPTWARGQRLALGLAVAVVLIVALLLVAARQEGPVEPAGLGWLALVLFVPVAEEFYFRGILLQYIRRQWGAPLAGLLSATLFVVLHSAQGPQAATSAALLALTCTLLTLATSTLLWAIAVHTAWNAAVVMLSGLAQPWWVATSASLAISLLIARALIATTAVPPLILPCCKS